MFRLSFLCIIGQFRDPCDLINERLLETGASEFALTHDSIWMDELKGQASTGESFRLRHEGVRSDSRLAR